MPDLSKMTNEELLAIAQGKASAASAMSTEELLKIAHGENPTPETPVAQGFIEGAGNFASRAVESIPIVGQLPKVAARGAASLLQGPGSIKIPYRSNYQTMKARDEAEEQRYEAENPILSFGASVVGGSMVPIKGPSLRLPEKAGKIGKLTKKVFDWASNVGANAGVIGADAALRGEDAENAALTAAGTIIGIQAGMKAVSKGAPFVGRVFTGVKPETARKYRESAGEINAISEEQVVDDIIADRQRALVDPLMAAEETARGAKETAQNARMLLVEGAKGRRAGARATGEAEERALRESASLAKSAADKAEVAFVEKLRKTKPPTDLPKKVTDAMKDLRGQVSKASTEAFQALQSSNQEINVRPLKAYLTAKINEFKVGLGVPGRGPVQFDEGVVPEGFKDAYRALVQERKFLNQFDETGMMRPEDAKRLVQALDAIEEKAWAKASLAGGYVDQGDRAMMSYRTFIDRHLKEVDEAGNAIYPGYKERMEQVVGLEQALVNARTMLGGNDRAVSKALTHLDSYQQQSLLDLGRFTNRDLVGPLRPFHEARRILSSPTELSERIVKLKTSVEAEAARARLQGFKPKKDQEAERILSSPTQMQREVEKMPEYRRQVSSEQDVKIRQEMLEPVKYLGDPGNVQAALRSVKSEARPNIKAEKALAYLKSQTGKDYLDQADKLAVKRAFDQGFTRGGRNVYLGTFSLSGALSLLARGVGEAGSAIAGDAGKVAGSLMGGVADLVGPKIYKKMIDLSLHPKFKEWAPFLDEAASRGPSAVALAIEQLSSSDRDFAEAMGGRSPGIVLPRQQPALTLPRR